MVSTNEILTNDATSQKAKPGDNNLAGLQNTSQGIWTSEGANIMKQVGSSFAAANQYLPDLGSDPFGQQAGQGSENTAPQAGSEQPQGTAMRAPSTTDNGTVQGGPKENPIDVQLKAQTQNLMKETNMLKAQDGGQLNPDQQKEVNAIGHDLNQARLAAQQGDDKLAEQLLQKAKQEEKQLMAGATQQEAPSSTPETHIAKAAPPPSSDSSTISTAAKTAAPTNAPTTSNKTSSSTSSSDSTFPAPQVAGTGSSVTNFGVTAQPSVDQTTPGYYVSPDGSANGDGSKAHPFATLQQAQTAMEKSNGAVTTTYVEGGTYNMSSSLDLTSKDSGFSFKSIGGPDNPAVLDGGGKLSDLISVNGANNITVQGFSMQNTSDSPAWGTKHSSIATNTGAIYAQDSSGDNFSYNTMNNVNVGINMQGDTNMKIFENSISNVQSGIDTGSDSKGVNCSNITISRNLVNGTGWGSKFDDNVGGVNLNTTTGVTMDNNIIENTQGVGLQVENGTDMTIQNNSLLNTNTIANTGKSDSANPVNDSGAAHFINSPGFTTPSNIDFSKNYINGFGPNGMSNGLYVDNGVKNLTATGNDIESTISNNGDNNSAGSDIKDHGGSGNTFTDNYLYMPGTNGHGIDLQSLAGIPQDGTVIDGNQFFSLDGAKNAYRLVGITGSDMPTFSGNEYAPGIDYSPDPNGTTT